MATGEEQPQQIVWKMVQFTGFINCCASTILIGYIPIGIERLLESTAPDAINHDVSTGGDKPRHRLIGHPVPAPGRQRTMDGIVCCVLGKVHISKDPREAGDHSRVRGLKHGAVFIRHTF